MDTYLPASHGIPRQHFSDGPDFDGSTYDAQLDKPRLTGQLEAVLGLMLADGAWRTLKEISAELGYPEASISARLRDLRKDKFGNYRVDRKRMFTSGLFAYRVLPPEIA